MTTLFMKENFSAILRDSTYTITAAAAGRYSLFYSLSPDGFTSDAWLCDFERTASVADPAASERCYFHLLDENANHWVTASRELAFSTIKNFRELGGYPAADGRYVRWGRFYRSARLTHLNEAETARFASLGVKSLLDLRSAGEISAHPDPVLEGAEQKAISAILQMDGNEKDFDPAHLITQSAEQMREDAREFMDIYRAMPFGNAAYQWMFDRLLAGQTPLLFHCTAGKDRTGVAAALILLALGVPRNVIEADYMRTNLCCEDDIRQMIKKYYTQGQPDFVKEYLTCIAGVGIQNLAAALDEIDKRYAVPEEFFFAQYGLDAKKIADLRSLYTQPVHA